MTEKQWRSFGLWLSFGTVGALGAVLIWWLGCLLIPLISGLVEILLWILAAAVMLMWWLLVVSGYAEYGARNDG